MKGASFASEIAESRDRTSGQNVRRLTNYKGHSHHLYFTNPGWWDGGRRLLFGSDRANRTDLFSMELATGAITQLTEHGPTTKAELLFSCVNGRRDEAYFPRDGKIIALDLRTLAEHEIYEVEPRFKLNILNCTADGRHLCTGVFEDLSDRFPVDLLHGYVGFHEYWEAHPLSLVLRIDVDGSGSETVFEEREWIGHVNTSPTRPELLSFCHEGPWEKVDHRVWALDLREGRVWKIRPTVPGDQIGHEYWLADGETIGYHGRIGGQDVFGFAGHDNTGRKEAPMPVASQHYHSNGRELIVGDGAGVPYVLLWRWRGAEIEPPRVLCEHHSSRHIQQTHVHPRFSPDGRGVLFTSDRTGYGELYLVDVPDIEMLPPLADLQH